MGERTQLKALSVRDEESDRFVFLVQPHFICKSHNSAAFLCWGSRHRCFLANASLRSVCEKELVAFKKLDSEGGCASAKRIVDLRGDYTSKWVTVETEKTHS